MMVSAVADRWSVLGDASASLSKWSAGNSFRSCGALAGSKRVANDRSCCSFYKSTGGGPCAKTARASEVSTQCRPRKQARSRRVLKNICVGAFKKTAHEEK